MTEIRILENDVIFRPSQIDFIHYQNILEDAKQVAEYLSQIEVTEDTIKEAKKIRASANKALTRLQDERKRIKKELMKPYELFNNQVQEIAEVVKEANSLVDEQIKEFEEKERDGKVKQVAKIWSNQTMNFKYNNLIHFEDFFDSKYANKTYSLNKIETEIAEFIEQKEKDIDYLTPKGEEYVIEYLKTFDVVHAMSTVEERQKAIKLLQETEIDEDNIVEVEKMPVAIFEIKGNAEIKLVEKLLQENEINYKKL